MLRRRPSGATDSISVTRAMQPDDRITPVSSSIEAPPSSATPPRMSRRANRYSSIDTATAPASAAASTVAAAHISSSASRNVSAVRRSPKPNSARPRASNPAISPSIAS